jgi:hypothetical protein
VAYRYERVCADCQAVFHGAKDSRRCRSCASREVNTVHGLSKHPLFRVWCAMRAREKNRASYHRKGVAICQEWDEPAVFVAWAEANGWRPGLTIDRVDNDGDYAPENCRFVTNRDNTHTGSRCRPVLRSDGIEYPSALEAARALGLKGHGGVLKSAREGRPCRGYTFTLL